MKRLLALAVAGMLLASACGSDDLDQSTTTGAPINTTTIATDQPTSSTGTATPTTAGDPVLLTVGLRSLGSCDDILDYYINNALELVGPYGLGGGDFRTFEVEAVTVTSAAARIRIFAVGAFVHRHQRAGGGSGRGRLGQDRRPLHLFTVG